MLRNDMRIGIGIIVVLMVSLSCAWGQSTQSSGGLTAGSSIDDVLDALDKVGTGLKDFTADVRLTETDTIAQDSSTRTGKVWYQKKTDGDSRLRVTFDTRTQDNATQQQRIDYLLENGWLKDRNYTRRIEVNRQVLHPGEKVNLLKLGEGPFPLPIGQKKEDVHRLFEVKKIEAAKDDPANTVHLELTPKPGTQFEKKFTTIDVWVDLNGHMPRRIQTLDKNGTTIRTTDLGEIKVNGGIADEEFVLPEIKDANWARHDEPFAG